jgi:tetratricopeptide (TPR) repeat protein
MPSRPATSLSPSLPAVAPPARNNAFTAAVALLVVFLLTAGGWAVMRAYRVFTQESRTNSAADGYARGAALYKEGKYEDAAAIFRQTRLSVTADPGIVRQATEGELYSYRKLGQQAQQRDDLMGAQHWFQEATKVAPDDEQAKSELDAVQKALLTNSAPSTPLAASSPAASPPATLPAASPSAPPPNTLTTSDFQNANGQAAAQADSLVQQGVNAYKNGEANAARNFWWEAVSAGPGSRASQQAQVYLDRLSRGKDPLGGG